MDKDRQKQWCDRMADELIKETDISILSILPSDLQLAISALVQQGFHRGYGWGFNDGRVYTGTGREPNYHVAEPAAENIAKPDNAA